MPSAIRIISEEASFCDQEFEAMLEAAMRGAPITYISANEAVETVSSYYIVDDLSVDPAVEGSERTVYTQRVMGDWVDMGLSPLDSEAIRRDRDAYVRHKRIFGDWGGLANTVVAGNRTYGCSSVSMDEIQTGRPPREHRFDVLRAEGKKLGEINAILEAEGYSEVFGEGVMPAPTKSHQIVRENKGARKLIETI